jgi:uncharacterized protein (DUF2345 family)
MHARQIAALCISPALALDPTGQLRSARHERTLSMRQHLVVAEKREELAAETAGALHRAFSRPRLLISSPAGSLAAKDES